MSLETDAKKALESIKAAQVEPNKVLGKASTFSQSNSATTGLTYYDLEPGAKFLYPVLTPLRNMIPRVSGNGGIQANWKAVTRINTTGIRTGVSQASRNAVMAVQVEDKAAAYRGLGIETSVDFEAQYAAENFADARAIAAKTGLEGLMLGEEILILGGNSATALGTPSTPVLVASTTGGGIASGVVVSVIVIALTLDGYVHASLTDTVSGLQGRFTRTLADGSTDTVNGGTSAKSAAANVTTGGSGSASVTATTGVVNGAVGYAWFWGTTGNEKLGAITTINSVKITVAQGAAAGATGVLASESLFSVDASQSLHDFDGLLAQAFAANSGATIRSMATGTAGVGTPLTADGAGGIVEIDDVLKSMWDNYRLSPDTMWVSSQEAQNVSVKILTGTSASAQRFVFNTEQSMIGGGIMVRTYLNKFSMAGGSTVDVRVHPNMPAGTILFTSRTLPYPLAGVGNLIQIRTRQDYYQIEWPLRTRKYEYGVYADEVLQHYFPPSMAVIRNIANG
jgi:hypothetical protein